MPKALRATTGRLLTRFRKIGRRWRRLRWRITPSSWRRNVEIVSEFSHHSYQRQLVSDISTILDAAGVEHLILDSRTLDRPELVVAGDDRLRVIRSLRAASHTTPWWMAVSYQRTTGRFAPARRSRRVASTSALVVNRNLVAPNGIDLIDDHCGAAITFWTRQESATPTTGGGMLAAGTLVAPAPNGVLDHIEAELWHDAQADGHRLPDEFPHLLLVTEPVDAVYIWGDNVDPLPTNEDGLRYSLRSLQAYADWSHRIWIVTDQQVPSWLRSDERLHIIRPHEVSTASEFSDGLHRRTIESQLHRIPGLASHYFVLTPNVLFGRPTNPELFFHGDRLLRLSPAAQLIDPGEVHSEDLPDTVAAKNSREFFREHFGRTITATLGAAPRAQLREVMSELDQAYPELSADLHHRTAAGGVDGASWISVGQYYAFITGRAVPGSLVHRDLDTTKADFPRTVESWLVGGLPHTLRLSGSASTSVSDERAAHIQDFLDSAFPLPSRWEKTS